MGRLLILPGDISNSRPGPETPLKWKALAWGIDFLTTEDGEKFSEVSHTFLFTKGGWLEEAELCEANAPVWRAGKFVDIYGPKGPAAHSEVEIWRAVWLTQAQRSELGRRAAARVGEPYNFARLFAFGLGNIFSRILHRSADIIPRFMRSDVCSTGSAEDLAIVSGIANPFGVAPAKTAPDNVHDWLVEGKGNALGFAWEKVSPRYGVPFQTYAHMLAAEAA
jgi:hypothetical protein